jgi:chaperone modulatory protein CbpM
MTDRLVRRTTLDLDTFARASGTHPDFVRQLVTLGLIEARLDARGELAFAPDQLAAAARVRRLHEGLGLNYAAIGLVADLLDRITDLERARRVPRLTGAQQWN